MIDIELYSIIWGFIDIVIYNIKHNRAINKQISS